MAPRKQNVGNVIIENAKIQFKNFSGLPAKFNAAGDRNFCILLDAPLAQRLSDIGWNIKVLTPRDPEDEPQPYIKVSVAYRGFKPPRAYIITSRGKTQLSENTITIMDFAEIKNVDLSIRPYVWDVNGETGIKAYLNSIWMTIEEDELDMKYSDVPDSAISAIGSSVMPEDD